MTLDNRPYESLSIGHHAEYRRLVTFDDLYVFAAATGNHNPMNLPDQDLDGDGMRESRAPATFVAAMVATTLGNYLPGPGTTYRSQSLRFHGVARVGDELVARVTVTGLSGGVAVLATEVACRGVIIAEGEAEVNAPDHEISFDDSALPGLIVQSHRQFEAILARARGLAALRTAVVWPSDAASLAGALRAMEAGLITPLLIGQGLRALASGLGLDLTGAEVIEAATDTEAAALAVDLVRQGRAGAVMKGHLHTDTLLRPMLARETGLRTGRRFSHVFVMDVPGVDHPILVSDAAINIAPDLETKVQITQNAIDLGQRLGIACPRVAVLSAVEVPTPDMPSSMDAAALAAMTGGRITGGVVEGPYAMDIAVNPAAARAKGVTGLVAGRADVLIVPGIEAGNILVKLLTHLAHAEAAGLVMGASVPVILTSRSDGMTARLVSCALAVLQARA
ncbi:bifunctional enoyl-CoA hydratase/phosphate acetyltransferase [Rhodobacter sp. KR11]|uniref:bifunctional enoyl-CoA hydratase/phosphate acetyltransferase n=1 Tax=Rhodobacter sp. KR11 TaxID=2974588 RepID=UPI0022224104|nr:bifunctional enoyl-CoA hydratase/phosphate acetyltransferase [Rhodobacter sp. KR11]MCW1920495.1 bifunctional enoyl-CoA hydratase/phosphate acetyltransferase [Rhodobacter sp. KR11]